jgi:hypothetical protein
MAKAEATVEELVSMIERGELRLPEMQRSYVWRSTRVRDLMDSLYRGYPSGAILVWETDQTVPLQEFAVSQRQTPYSTFRLLLDGQQRLTSLSAVIRGEPVHVRGRRRPIDLLFNLDHPDELNLVTEVDEDAADDEDDLEDGMHDSNEDELQERFNSMTFVVATKKLEALPQWVRVSEVFKSDNDIQILRDAGVTNFDDPRFKKYSDRLARLRAIKRYSYRMDVLERHLSYNEVTEIFVRVNSLGAKLRSSDLALAQITAKWRGSLTVFQEFQNECERKGFDLDLGIILKNMVVFATGQSRFQTVGSLSADKLQEAWKQSVEGIEFATNFLRSNARIDSPALLSSPFLIVALSFFGHSKNYHLSPKEAAQLNYWVLLANAKGRYSRGSSETLLDQDLNVIKQGLGPDGLIEKLKSLVGRLDFTPSELAGRNQRSAVFKTMFLAFREAGAKDWQSNLNIALDHSGSIHKLQFHHIFPKAFLKDAYSPREADDIANLSFIGGKTNRKISAKDPQTYIPDLIEKIGIEAFLSQAIPTDENLLSKEKYKDFLAKRRELICERLNEFLSNAAKVQKTQKAA